LIRNTLGELNGKYWKTPELDKRRTKSSGEAQKRGKHCLE